MASGAVRPKLAYIVCYVEDVGKSAAFYAKAFNYSVRRVDDSHKWAELDTGSTTIAFTPRHQRARGDLLRLRRRRRCVPAGRGERGGAGERAGAEELGAEGRLHQGL
ncbi:unnamed protein product [Triticum turgidum subsp. durum]|uniref:Glyoxalase/fosfomycin resistance/dioxygenase domain-containing protein n=1 Tax=Triticum turgidum subsp. durum TaxID=4567 RepID=A0A9R0S614_TRITD|nr:unnamed protein product [Triticum turgidum subsp. durum]